VDNAPWLRDALIQAKNKNILQKDNSQPKKQLLLPMLSFGRYCT
jgi:hypothetical protein